MLKATYIAQIAAMIKKTTGGKPVQVFLFGSSVRKEKFGDCDLGVLGHIGARDLKQLKELFEESTLPYKVDVVDFNKVSSAFRKNVFAQKMIWIKR